MNLSAAFIERLVAEGGQDAQGLADVARISEKWPNGQELFEAILTGLERAGRSSEAPEYLAAIIAQFPVSEDSPKAVNDRVPRMSSEQRRIRYTALAERDGLGCADCGCEECIIWRRMGVWSNDFGRYTKVHPTPNLEVDHRTPLWAGGDNSLSNLWLLCIDCHKRKTAAEAGERRRA